VSQHSELQVVNTVQPGLLMLSPVIGSIPSLTCFRVSLWSCSFFAFRCCMAQSPFPASCRGSKGLEYTPGTSVVEFS
jgi:hypothetical protein